MPPVSEAQRKAMWAAAEGHSSLGIPQEVGKEFVSDSDYVEMVRRMFAQDAPYDEAAHKRDAQGRFAAGVMVTNKEGKILFLKRGEDTEHPGTWAFPAGKADPHETPVQTAAREVWEETGLRVRSLTPVHRTVHNGLNFHTFAHELKGPWQPKLNWEHTEHAWAHPHELPEPLHPGVRAMFDEMKQATDSRPWQAMKVALKMPHVVEVLDDIPDQSNKHVPGGTAYAVDEATLDAEEMFDARLTYKMGDLEIFDKDGNPIEQEIDEADVGPATARLDIYPETEPE